MIGLTHRQAAALRFIIGFTESHGVAPSQGEIAAGIGMKSPPRAHYLLNRLEERGAIRRVPQRPRAIEVLHPVSIPRAPDGAPLYFVKVPQ